MTRSPRHLKEHVRETVSDLPVHAARLAVLGVGKALMFTDRVRKDYREVRESGLRPVVGRLREDAGNFTGKVVHKVAGRLPGAGRAEDRERPERRPRPERESEIVVGKPPAPPGPAAKPPGPVTAAPEDADPGDATSKPATSRPAASRSATEPRPGTVSEPRRPAAPTDAGTKATEDRPAPAADAQPASELPVPGYDSATIASVRARLRSLTVKQVSELRDYERANAARAEFLRMFENRIAKLRERQG